MSGSPGRQHPPGPPSRSTAIHDGAARCSPACNKTLKTYSEQKLLPVADTEPEASPAGKKRRNLPTVVFEDLPQVAGG
ncbi:uncharacterized protein LOC119291072 isoform X3 [Triticum dicoccoides]|uniref:uncharacterized protein LOC119291072 isoform X3 n=1 Tax=Triticum dicoccoides TaxID=85692 RepID=UPI00188E79F4|nr:uncharacterized protein LOC119291072 isoform X3 [Triticum dicoccoides]